MTESRRIDRLHKIQELLGRRRIVYRSELLEKFGISRATLNRDLAELRNRYQVPIDFNQEYGGYLLGPAGEAGGQFGVPHGRGDEPFDAGHCGEDRPRSPRAWG